MPSSGWTPNEDTKSKNPFLSFRFSGGKPGDKVIITWTDNKGEKRTGHGQSVNRCQQWTYKTNTGALTLRLVHYLDKMVRIAP